MADLTTLAAAPAAPMKSFNGLEVVLAAAILTRSWVDRRGRGKPEVNVEKKLVDHRSSDVEQQSL